MAIEITVPQPLEDSFEFRFHTPVARVLNERQQVFRIEKTLYPTPEEPDKYGHTSGIYIYYQGVPFPRRGWPFPEAIDACSSVKKITVGNLAAFANKRIIPLAGLFLMYPWKQKIALGEAFLWGYVRSADVSLNLCYLKESYYTDVCRELRKFIQVFMEGLGFSKDLAENLAKILATLVEYDDAYRYRIEDMLTGLSEDIYNNPRKEIKRIINKYISREQLSIQAKFQRVSTILSTILWIPKVRRAFLKAIKSVDINKLGMDEIDYYHILLRDGYNFAGKTLEQRNLEYKEIHKHGLPFTIGIQI